MPILHANDIAINYTLQGPSTHETVVLINGLADDLESWSLQTPALLSANYRILTFDNRGVGKTSSPPGPYTADLLATDTKALVSALALPKFHLMGISMGGMIAQAYALKYGSSDLLSLTLACTYSVPGPFCSRMFQMWEDAVRTQGSQGKAFVAMDTLLWCFTLEYFTQREAEFRQVEAAVVGAENQSLEAYLAQLAVIQNFDSRKEVGSLGKGGYRVMVLAGEQDILIPTQASRELHGMIEGSEWRTVKGGHGCSWEFPESFNEAFVGFLKG